MRSMRRILALLAVSVCALCIHISVAAPQKEAPKANTIPSPEARVDINHATIDDLIKVPGMTRTWAGRIVRFRPYRTKADLLERGVVTSEVYNRIKDYVIAHRDAQ